MIDLTFFANFTATKDEKYCSPPQLRYPQLSYFRSNAILSWVQKNSSQAIFPPSYAIFFFFSPVMLPPKEKIV